METNLLVALSNLVKDPIVNLVSHYRSVNRANSMGEALEFYIKDLFCGSFHIDILADKNEVYSKYFSYLGNQNNPPDIIIKQGDAIEVKKIESMRSGLALNSSYPKNKLRSDSPMITGACRACEDWREKDIIYTVGVANDGKLKALWFVYGDCYAADKEVYERVGSKISSKIKELEGVEFSKTKELARVNQVDPLGITYLRIRGMWGIDNPIKVFEYAAKMESGAGLAVNAIMLAEKYLSFPEKDRKNIENLAGRELLIKDIKIKSPNNPAKLLNAKLISFTK
jgi:hypothetical protein